MANVKSTTRSEHEVTPAVTRGKRRVILEDTEEDGLHSSHVSGNRESSQPDESASEVPETMHASQSSSHDRPSSPEPDDDEEETTARTAGRNKGKGRASHGAGGLQTSPRFTQALNGRYGSAADDDQSATDDELSTAASSSVSRVAQPLASSEDASSVWRVSRLDEARIGPSPPRTTRRPAAEAAGAFATTSEISRDRRPSPRVSGLGGSDCRRGREVTSRRHSATAQIASGDRSYTFQTNRRYSLDPAALERNQEHRGDSDRRRGSGGRALNSSTGPLSVSRDASNRLNNDDSISLADVGASERCGGMRHGSRSRDDSRTGKPARRHEPVSSMTDTRLARLQRGSGSDDDESPPRVHSHSSNRQKSRNPSREYGEVCNKRVSGGSRRASMSDERIAYRKSDDETDDGGGLTPEKRATTRQRREEYGGGSSNTNEQQITARNSDAEIFNFLLERFGRARIARVFDYADGILRPEKGRSSGAQMSTSQKGAVQRQMSVFSGGWVGGKATTDLYGAVSMKENVFVRTGCILMANEGSDDRSRAHAFKTGMSGFRSEFLKQVRHAIAPVLLAIARSSRLEEQASAPLRLLNIQTDLLGSKALPRTSEVYGEFLRDFWAFPMSGHQSQAVGKGNLELEDVYGAGFERAFYPVALRVISKVVPILEAEYREAHRTDGGGSHGSTMEEVEYRIRAWAIQIVPRAQSVDSSEHRRKQSVHEKAWIQGFFGDLLELVCQERRPACVLMHNLRSMHLLTTEAIVQAVQPYNE